ncbi:MAG TPA: DUF2252 domain-containing protein [Thermoleophilia bacterium]|nr:DUF2252 domain-containing protein [Thermoleophilia bacterium]
MATRTAKNGAGKTGGRGSGRPAAKTKNAAKKEAAAKTKVAPAPDAAAKVEPADAGWLPARAARPAPKTKAPRPAQAATAATPADLRRRKRPSRDERSAAGKVQRQTVPLEALGAFEPADDRRDPVAILEQQEKDRLRFLVPVRHARMLQNAFGFYRGAPAIMAADLGAGLRTDLEVQLCGDAHLLNFGVYGSPERSLVFDVNDFDETLPGPFEWDVKRLVASLAVAARQNGFSRKKERAIASAGARAYRTFMRRFSELDTLTIWYTQLGVDRILEGIHDPVLRADAAKTAARATSRDSAQAAAKLSTVVDGVRQVTSAPPLIISLRDVPLGLLPQDIVRSLKMNFETYRRSLRQDVKVLVDRYRFDDIALKVVGVGSVGMGCFIGVLTGHDEDDVLFLQVKEAVRSVLEPYLRRSRYKHQGERVVSGQRITQSASDIFLGWSHGPAGGDFYWRQLRDWKGSVDTTTMDVAHLLAYGELCAWTLAKGHARSGDPVAISSYLGKRDRFDVAMADFAQAYADQNEADYSAMQQAAEHGRIEVSEGI